MSMDIREDLAFRSVGRRDTRLEKVLKKKLIKFMRFISYFIEDIKNIFKRPKSIGTLLVLMILPGFYAWFNIVASWDPYGNTKNIKIAVTNNDI